MIIGRIIGWLVLMAALVAAGAEAVRSLEAGAWQPLGLATPWFGLGGTGMEAARETVRSLVPEPFDALAAMLFVEWPAWLILAIPGAVLARLFRSKPRRQRRFS